MKVLFAIKEDNGVVASLERKFKQDNKTKFTYNKVDSLNAIIKELQKSNYNRVVVSEDFDEKLKYTKNTKDQAKKYLKKIVSSAGKAKVIFCANDKSNLKDLVDIDVYNIVIGKDKIKKGIYDFLNNPNSKEKAIEMYGLNNAEPEKKEVKAAKTAQNTKVPKTANKTSKEKVSSSNVNDLFTNIKYLNREDLEDDKYVKRFDSISSKFDKTSMEIIVKSLSPATKKILRKKSSAYNELLGLAPIVKKSKEDSSETETKRRGRPRKEKTEQEDESKVVKRRGRPRKEEVAQENKNEKKKADKKNVNIVTAAPIVKTSPKKQKEEVKIEDDDDFLDLDDFIIEDEPKKKEQTKKESKKIEEPEEFDLDGEVFDIDDEDLDLEDEVFDIEDEEKSNAIEDDLDDDEFDFEDDVVKNKEKDEDLDEDFDLDDDDALDEEDVESEEDDEDFDLEDDDIDDDEILDFEDDEEDSESEEDDEDFDLEDDDIDDDEILNFDEDDEEEQDEKNDNKEEDSDEDDEDFDLEDDDIDDDEILNFDEDDEEDSESEEDDEDLDLEDDDIDDDEILNFDEDDEEDSESEEDDEDFDLEDDDIDDDEILNFDEDDEEEQDEKNDNKEEDSDEDDDDDILSFDDEDESEEDSNTEEPSEDDDDILNFDDDDSDENSILNFDEDDESEDEGVVNDSSDETTKESIDESDDDIISLDDEENEDDDLISLDDDSEDDDILNLDEEENEEDSNEAIQEETLKIDENNNNGTGFGFAGIQNINYNSDNDISKQINEINEETESIEDTSSEQITQASLNISQGQKIVAFVGGHGNGTSFIVNNMANLLADQGINVAILDVTKNKNSYYIYTENQENLRGIAYSCFEKLNSGIADGIKVNKNLTVYTSLPNSNATIENIENAMNTILSNNQLVLIDCDVDTEEKYFELAEEIYLVQSLDILTIQPLTSLLKRLKMNQKLDESKLRILINKEIKVNELNDRIMISAMSVYNSPDTTYQLDLFNRDTVQYLTIPFEEKNYCKYLGELARCKLRVSGYSKSLINSFNKLAKMIYPIGRKRK